jgi:hypothetical protein
VAALGKMSIYDEVFEFLLSQPTLEQIAAFHRSMEADERLHNLLDKNQADRLTSEEQSELDEYLGVEHFIRMLKIKAREKLQQGN